MKKIIGLMLSVLIVLTSVIAISAMTTSAAETKSSAECYSELLDHIKKYGKKEQNDDGSYTYSLYCYRRSSDDYVYFLTNDKEDEISIMFYKSESESRVLMSDGGYISLSPDSSKATYKSYYYYVGYPNVVDAEITGTIDVVDFYFNDKDLTYDKFDYTFEGNVTKETALNNTLTLAEPHMKFAIGKADLYMKDNLGYGLEDMYQNSNTGSGNTENGDEATPDSQEPTTPQPAQSGNSATSNQTSQSSSHAIQTGANTYAVVMIVMAAGLVLFVTAFFLKKKTN